MVGSSLRGLFTAVQESSLSSVDVSNATAAQMYGAIAGGGAVAVGAGVIAFEAGTIWMLIPTVLGAVVAVAVGLITIALRQAVVMLLIMIAPLAMVAYMLPNTEQWFKKWKDLLTKMLVFYPMFSLLFGASSLAGFAIIASAKSGFGLLLGIAVQIFPLFFAWKMMQMSGTILGTVGSKLQGLASRPVGSVGTWASSRQQATRAKHLASTNKYRPSLRLMQYMSDRKIAREAEAKENEEFARNRGLAYRARRNYDKNGVPTREAERDYEKQAKNMEYARVVTRHENNMNKGLGQLVAVENAKASKRARLNKLDSANVTASGMLKMEKARGEKIEYDNAVGFHNRMEAAINAHMDDVNGYEKDKDGKYKLDENGKRIRRGDYEFHFDGNKKGEAEAMARYNVTSKIMEGNAQDVQYAAAAAAHNYDAQNKIITTKFQKYFELTPPTRDLRYRLEEFSQYAKKVGSGQFAGKAVDNIDAIVSGLRILNQRGDTDFVKDIMDDLLNPKYGGVRLGTHASQALASFLMFDVKDSDPYMRRFGKYINLETARMYDKNKRQKELVDYEEYVKGYHVEPNGEIMYAKKDMVKLMEGTSLDGIERTALDNYHKSLKRAYTDENGKLDLEAYKKKKKEVDAATAPQFISANMKFLSGSEQITSAVKAKTGYASVQDSATGKYSMVPIWDDEEEAKVLFGAYDTPEEKEQARKDLKEMYREQTLQYLKDQTPAQILGLRSDYKEPLLAHLSDAYLEDDEHRAKHDEEVAEINARYADMDPEMAVKGRKKDLNALRMKEAGEQLRTILYENGKLDQLEKSKRSGAANNAKDWVRELLLLDKGNELRSWIWRHDNSSGRNRSNGANNRNARNEQQPPQSPNGRVDQDEVRRKMRDDAQQKQKQQRREQIKKMLEELKEQQKREADANLTPDKQSVSAYSVEDLADLSARIEDLWYEVRDDSGDDNEYDKFFEASHDFIGENLGTESYIVKAYEKYYRDNPNGDSYDLREYLIELLKSLLDD